MQINFKPSSSFIETDSRAHLTPGERAAQVPTGRRGTRSALRVLLASLFPGVDGNAAHSAPPIDPSAQILAPRTAEIPEALKKHSNRWGPWRAKKSPNGKLVKMPSTGTGQPWGSFEQAARAIKKDTGIGWQTTVKPEIGLDEHGIVAIDLDKCVAHGEIAPWAAEVVAKSATYAEFSPSGNGLRLFGFHNGWADMPPGHAANVEIYAGTSARYVTVTGHRLPDSPPDLREVSAEFLNWLEGLRAIPKAKHEVQPVDGAKMPAMLPDAALPPLASLNLSERTLAFLAGESQDDDRSRALAAATADLYAHAADDGDGQRDATVLSLLWTSDAARGVALDHRGQDDDRALVYLWDQHCAKVRTRVRPLEEGFAAVVEVDDAAPPLPSFNRTNTGRIKAELNNVLAAVARPDICGFRIGFDSFRDETMLARPGSDEWVAATDDDYVRLRSVLESGQQGFAPIGRDLIRDAVSLASKQHGFDSATLWLDSLRWDGVPRIEYSLREYFGADDTAYARAVSLYLWTALAGRVLSPGVKADMAPVAIGKQGIRKSSTIAAIAPAHDHFLEMDLSLKDNDLSRLMRGKLVIELAELQGLRSRALEHIKAFITKQHEHWVQKYKELATSYPRRGVFFGSTNEREFLADPTGNRRWLPFVAGACDPDAMARDRSQLWAEAATVFRKRGIVWRDAEKLAAAEHDKFVVRDAWDDAIERWLDSDGGEFETDGASLPNGETPFTSAEVLTGALHLQVSQIGHAQKIRVANILGRLGYENHSTTINGKDARAWRKAGSI